MKILLIVGFITSYCSLFLQSAFVEGRGANGQNIWAENVAGTSLLSSTSFGVSADYKFRSLTFNLKLAQTLCCNNTPIKSGSVEGNTWTEIKLALKWVL